MPTESNSLDSSRVWAERMLQQLEDQDQKMDSGRMLDDNPLEFSNLSSASIGSSHNSHTLAVSPLPSMQTHKASPASTHSDSTLEYGSPVNILSSSFSFCLSESHLSSSEDDVIPTTTQQESRKLAIEEIPVSDNSFGNTYGAKLDLDQQLQEIESKKKALQAKSASDSPSFILKDASKSASLKFRTLKHLSKSTIASPNTSSLTSQLPLKKAQRTPPTTGWTPEKENKILQELPKNIPLPVLTAERNAHVSKLNSMLKESGFALLIPQTPSEGKLSNRLFLTEQRISLLFWNKFFFSTLIDAN